MVSQAKSQAPAYNFMEDVENVSKYRAGGFHPVSIGDAMKEGRYRVVHKLGYGGYSTTWLALDTLRRQYVAVKICSADSREESLEGRILQQLSHSNQGGTAHPGERLVRTLIDNFDIQGPNGHHKCLVMPPAIMTIRDAQEASYSRLFRPEIARSIVAQLVLAVDFVHSKGIVHADIHPGNIFFRLPRGIDDLTPDEIYRRYGEPELEIVTRTDGHLVVPIWMGKASEDVEMPEAEVLLGDFGESFIPSSTDRLYSNSPPSFRPPETRFPPTLLGFPADIWSLACLVWEVLGQRPLFESWMATDDEVLADQVDLLGKLPFEWWTRWDARSAFYVEDGELGIELTPERPPGTVRRGWTERLELCIQRPRREEGLDKIGEDERAALLSMLRSMLQFEPERRATAEHLRQSGWMEHWAAPKANVARSHP